jgi:hypothetical protein
MSRSTLVLLSAWGGIAVLVAAGLGFTFMNRSPETRPDRWPDDMRTSFVDSCVKSCRASPGVTPDRYPQCDQMCKCTVDEAEKSISSTDLTMIFLAEKTGLASSEQKEKMKKLMDTTRACATKVAKGRTG